MARSVRLADSGAKAGRGRWRRRSTWLLLLPFLGLLYPALYARDSPRLGSLPFFIWYQLGWVVLGALATGIVHLLRAGSGQES